MGEERGEMGEERGEMGEERGEMGEERGEMGEERGEMGEERGEMGEERGEMGEERGEMIIWSLCSSNNTYIHKTLLYTCTHARTHTHTRACAHTHREIAVCTQQQISKQHVVEKIGHTYIHTYIRTYMHTDTYHAQGVSWGAMPILQARLRMHPIQNCSGPCSTHPAWRSQPPAAGQLQQHWEPQTGTEPPALT